MAITPQNLTAFLTLVDTRVGMIWQDLDADETEGLWTTDDPMTGGSQKVYAWTGLMPKPRPWFGSRVMYEAAPQTYTVVPIPYELTYGIDQFILDDSDPNAESYFWRMLPDMARQWRRQKCYEVRDLLENSGVQTGSRQNGWDGLSFFNTAHPIDYYNPGFNPGGMFTGGTYCNDFTGGGQVINGVTVGGALSQTSFASLLQYMKMIPGEDGEVLGVSPDSLMHPSTLTVETMFILKASFLAPPQWGAWSPLTGQVGTADNQLAKVGVNPICNPFLKNTKNWYLMDTKRSYRSVIWVVREAPRTVPRVLPNDPIVFDSHKYAWGGWDRVTPAWGPSFLMARSGP